MNASSQALQLIHEMPLDEQCIATIRTLAMDAVEQARSGHPGTPMALAPAAYALWTQVMRYNPSNPEWFDRDRFVLSNGHASMLLALARSDTASPQGWLEWVGGGGAVIGIEGFGASAPSAVNFEHYGFTIENVKEKAMQLMEGQL